MRLVPFAAPLCLALAACPSDPAPLTGKFPPPEYEPPREGPGSKKPELPPVETAEPEPRPPPKICTKMGCTSTVDLELDGKPGQKGTFLVEVTAGDQRGKCEFKLPMPACGQPASRCEGTLPIMARESGCDKPKKEQTLLPITIGVTPDSLEVVVKRDGKKVAEETVTPAYETLQPNGPECPPTCKLGKQKITVK